MKTILGASLVTALFATASVMGCAKDAQTEVRSAEDAQSSERAKYQEKAQDLTQKQRDEQAELARKQAEERAEVRGDYRESAADKQKDVTRADANMTAERRAFQAKANERLEKIDARATEASTKMQKANAKARSAAQADWNRYTEQRDRAAAKIRAIPSVANERWEDAKKEIDATLDDADKAVDMVSKRL